MSTIPPVSDPRFDPGYEQPDQAPKKRNFWATCLIGCLVMLVVLFVLGAILIYWISQQWRGWTADFGSQLIKQAIAASALPAQEKDDINVQVDRLATAFRENRLSAEQWTIFVQNMTRSPLMTTFMASTLDQAYLAKSGLTAEEKAAGRKTLQRFLRGVIDEKIDQQGIDAAMVHVASRRPDGQWELRQRLSDAELKAFLTAAKAEADEAGVEEEPADFDPSDEFKRIVDEALAQPGDDGRVVPDPPGPPVEPVPPVEVVPEASPEVPEQRP